MGARGPIPFTAIDRYAERYRIADFEEFHHLIRSLEAAQARFERQRAGK